MTGKVSIRVETFKPMQSHSLVGAIAALLEAFPRAFDESAP